MLVSVASFYATYIQAISAEQQVKAMTYPLIQFTTGNFDTELKEQKISLTIRNSGVGPAIIHQLTYQYRDKNYPALREFLKACCEKELVAFRLPENQKDASVDSQIITSRETGVILAASDDIDLFQLLKRPSNEKFWNKINEERRYLRISACYCSLLEDCYISKEAGNVLEVEACPAE